MDSDDTHECFHCGEEFSSIIDFNVHLETHSKNGTPSKSKVDLTDRGGKSHECFHCGEGFYTTSDLDKHMKTHDTAKTQTVIKSSSVDTGGVVDLTDPVEDPYECFHCGKEFAQENDLNSHLVKQHQVKPHKCDQCSEVFMHQYQLEAHKLIHRDVSARVMSDVEMMYRSYNNNRASTSSYRDEVEDAASTSQSEYECTYCGQFFKNQGALSTHKLIHTAKQCHKCTYCSKIFTHPSDLKRHLVMHTGEKTNACHLCPKKFSQTSALYHHMRSSHRTQPHNCDHCGEGFNKMTDLRAHKRSHFEVDSYVVPQKKPYLSQHTEDGNLYKCALCGDSFTEKSSLDVHSQIHMSNTIEIIPETDNENFMSDQSQPSTNVGTFKCPKCTKMFAEEAELNRHMPMCIPSSMDLSIHVKKEKSEIANNITDLGVVDLTLDDDDDDEAAKYFCTCCDKSFHLEVELNAHQIMFHSTPDSHECFHCGEEFDMEDELKLHVLTTHDGKGLKHHECQDCDQSFLLVSDFEDHKKQKHPACKVCGKTFTKNSSLDRHMRDNHDLVFYTCNYCKKTYSTKAELETHKNTQHKISNPSQNKASTSSQQTVFKSYNNTEFPNANPNADISERQDQPISDVVDLTIDDDEIYKCSICTDVFSREEELIVHMMTHPKQEPFECPECGKRFVFEKDYRFHLRSHVKAENIKKRPPSTNNGKKPHECPVCQKRFASVDVLNRHKATHGAEPHKCPHCGAGFWQDYYLQRHLQRDCKRLREGIMQNGNISGSSAFDIPTMQLPKITSVQTIVEKAHNLNDAIDAGPLPLNNSIKSQGVVAQAPMPIKQETYTCCGWSFMSEADMKVHELSHKVTVYKCVQCKQVFRSPAELDTHVQTHSQMSSPHKVPYHDESSNSSTLTAPSTGYVEDLHTSFSPKKEQHECHKCGKVFKTEGFLNRHMRLHKSQVLRTEKCHRCNECGQRFLSEAGLNKHAATHSDNKPNQCPICNENFENSAKLFEHMATHESGKAHTCPQCGTTFNRSASLRSHMKMHAQEIGDTYEEQDFDENDDMPNRSVPTIPKPNIPRPSIPVPFIPTPSIYATNGSKPNGANLIPNQMQLPHVRQEDGADTGHMCTYCGKKFMKESLLKRHFRKHMRILSSTYCETKVKFDASGKELRTVTRIRKKRFKCYICYKMFRTPSDLVRHMMIHTGERPCKCSWCPQGFILLHSLKRHTLKYHRDILPRDGDLGEKEREDASNATSKVDKGKKGKHSKYVRPAGYLCCGIRFPTLLDIQHHWLVHKEEEAYACPHCDLRFTKGYTRTKHIMKVHSATKPNCLDCGKEFNHFDKLIEHMKVHEAQLVGTVPDSNAAPASTNRVEVYTDVADSGPPSTNRVEVYTDVADVDSVLVKTEVIPDEDPREAPVLPRLDNILHTAPDPLLLKQESALNSDHEIEPTDSDVSSTNPKSHPISLKNEGNVATIGDPPSPVDDAVLDSYPEEKPISLKKEAVMDTDGPTPGENADHEAEANVSP